MNKYDKCIELWDDIFSKQESVLPKKKNPEMWSLIKA